MDFDIGTLIYIIITIVAIIAGAVGKKKKPTVTEPVTEEKKRSGGILGMIEKQLEGFVSQTSESVNTFKNELFPDESQAENYMQSDSGEDVDIVLDAEREYSSEYVEEAVQEYSYMQNEGEYDPDALENLELMNTEALRTTEDVEIAVVEMDHVYSLNLNEIVEEFDLGKAVVYSAILNRIEY